MRQRSGIRTFVWRKQKFISSERRNELLRYAITGGIATVMQYALYLLGLRFCALPAEAAAVGSYAISLACNFFLSNFFTFRTKPNKRKAVSFVASHMINLGLQTLLVFFFKFLVGEVWALVPAMAICVPVNYFLVRFALTSRRFQS